MSAATLPEIDITPALRDAAERSKAWPFEEARKIVERIARRGDNGAGGVLFETGYGPSGLPHIGTFGEVARTTMVRTAFRVLTGDAVPTRLLCFSDDMDGLRKVPDNVPNKEMMRANLGKPLTSVPDPFSDQYPSFGAANNARLRAFLDRFGFAYEFASATDYYRSGRFDATLLTMLERYDEVMAIMLPSLREERRETYSPFLPVSPTSGQVLQVPILERKLDAGTIVYRDPDSDGLVEVPVTGGHVKCQWKADWALRWTALAVDYEMSGKDLIDSVKLSSRICAALGGTPPDGFNYELFLDENGQKISKSKGNGLTIDEWLAYASPESLALYMFQRPRAAKRLYFDVIPKAVDEYFSFLGAFPKQPEDQRLGNPVWHIHAGAPPAIDMPIGFAMLLNLAARLERPRQGGAVGFHSTPRSGRHPGEPPQARRAGRLRGPLLRRFRRAQEGVPPPRPRRTHRARSPRPGARPARGGGRGRRRRHPERHLRGRPLVRALPGQGQGRPRRPPRRRAHLVRDALPGSARHGARSPFRLVRGDLRHPRDPGADRPRAQGRAGRRSREGGLIRRWHPAVMAGLVVPAIHVFLA